LDGVGVLFLYVIPILIDTIDLLTAGVMDKCAIQDAYSKAILMMRLNRIQMPLLNGFFRPRRLGDRLIETALTGSFYKALRYSLDAGLF
jgi:hypothetical protein